MMMEDLMKTERTFMRLLDVDDEVAAVLADAGFVDLTQIASTPWRELARLPDFDEGLAREVRARAKELLAMLFAMADEPEER